MNKISLAIWDISGTESYDQELNDITMQLASSPNIMIMRDKNVAFVP